MKNIIRNIERSKIEVQYKRIAFKALGIGLILFGIFISQKEIRLRIWGIQANARIIDVTKREGAGFGGTGLDTLTIIFSTKDNQTYCSTARYNHMRKYRKDEVVEILYLPKNPHTLRIADYSLMGTGLCLIIGGILLFFFYHWD